MANYFVCFQKLETTIELLQSELKMARNTPP